jgi:conjugal transfer/entry exclusion protein
MEGLGGAASVITVIELSAKITSACVQYSRGVKHAAEDINQLQDEVKSLQDVLQNFKQLLDGLNRARLSAPQRLSKEIDGCGSELSALDQRLNPSKSRKAMSRVGFRALK